MSSVPVILNRHARGARPAAIAAMERAFAAAGLEADIRPVAASEVEDAARRAAASSIVAVAGGDGSLSCAAGALVGSGACLVPVPLGTLNHFARRLGIDSPAASARAIVAGHAMRVPVGSVNGRPFINNVSIGIYPRFVRTRERLRGALGRRLAIGAAALYSLGRLHQVTLGIEACGTKRERLIAGVWIGLGRGSFRLPDDAEPIAARNLEVVIAPGHSRLRLVLDAVRAVATLRRGDPPHQTGLEMLHAPVVTLTTTGPLDLARDGEAEWMASPVSVMVLQGALRVMSLEPLRPPDPPVQQPREAGAT
jgi:diacylglycerol kinase family enzyme